MNRQWMMVATIIGGIALGAWALTRIAPAPEHLGVGSRIPEYRLLDVATGDSIDLRAGYDGSVTLINVWATWCPPCIAEMPSMEKLYQEYRDRGFRIAAVSIDAGNADQVSSFAKNLGVTFDILHDRSGAIQQTYQTMGVPQSFLVDRKGRIRYISLGAEHWDSAKNQDRVAELLD